MSACYNIFILCLGLFISSAIAADAPSPPSVSPETNAEFLPNLIQKEAPNNYTDTVILQGLNKITARTSVLNVKVGESIQFGTLEILVKKCWKSSPDEMPDNKALLEIWGQNLDESKVQLFMGWMFSSSPAISALEHPIYDITVIECTNKEK